MRKATWVVLAVALTVLMALPAFAARTGKEVYEGVCKACHATGISGAPKFGDKKWLAMEKKEGIKELTADAMKGKKAMPPKGGCADCSETEIEAAIQYMIDSAKGK